MNKDLLQVRHEFDREKIVSKLDTALLFFVSSANLVFVLGYTLFVIEWLKIFTPYLIVAWIMPLYVGYIRGVLVQDSIDERIRGWVYFVTGIIYYTILSVGVIATVITSNMLYIPTAIIAFVGFLMLRVFNTSIISSAIIHTLFKIDDVNINVESWRAILETELASVSLAVSLTVFGMIWLFLFPVFQLTQTIIAVVIIAITLTGAIFLERKARELLKEGYRKKLYANIRHSNHT